MYCKRPPQWIVSIISMYSFVSLLSILRFPNEKGTAGPGIWLTSLQDNVLLTCNVLETPLVTGTLDGQNHLSVPLKK